MSNVLIAFGNKKRSLVIKKNPNSLYLIKDIFVSREFSFLRQRRQTWNYYSFQLLLVKRDPIEQSRESCGWPKESKNATENLSENPLMCSKIPITGR